MSGAVLQPYRTDILTLAMRHGARDVRVFGSLARGEGHEGSDLDLLVTLEEGRSLWDLVGLKQDLEDLLHRPVDTWLRLRPSPHICESVFSPKPSPCEPKGSASAKPLLRKPPSSRSNLRRRTENLDGTF